MALAVTTARSTFGIHAKPVSVEVHLSNGLPGFTIVGLPETAVKESRDRVRSAIINSQFEFPCRHITVNLAPADLPKTGSGFDLSIAIGILAASGQIPTEALSAHELVGELALSGCLRPIKGIIPMILSAKQANHVLIIPSENANEAAIVNAEAVFSATHLREVAAYFAQKTPLAEIPKHSQLSSCDEEAALDWSDIKGQPHAKRAMTMAAVGGHSILLSGPPGSGKTMLARRLPSLIPLLSTSQALECAAITSIRGQMPDYQAWRNPPFRAPHHTASQLALVGGGNPPKPGEISLAHHGILFLDELPEFSKLALETLRQPMESGQIVISRAAIQTEFPARFQFVAAMNPCPCGQWGNPQANCLCAPDKINRYLGKISGPILDRIDMHVMVSALSQEALVQKNENKPGESRRIREKVEQLRDLQHARQGCLNTALGSRDVEKVCDLGPEEMAYLNRLLSQLKLSARGFHRLLKVARTIADFVGSPTVTLPAIQEAFSYKQRLITPL